MILEDNYLDERLLLSRLHAELPKFEYVCVDGEKDFLNALHTFKPDIILSDFNLSEYDGMQALKSLRERQNMIPFIFVTGTLGEEQAVECIKAGANDFVLKQNMNRLPLAIERSLKEYQTEQDRRELKEELKHLNRNLERQVKQRTEELAEANRELESFNYTVSHDLRTPLAAAELFCNGIEDKLSREQYDKIPERITSLRRSLKEMNEMIHDLLAYSLMGKRVKKYDHINMSELFNEVFEEVSPAVADKKLHFKVSKLPDAVADRSMLRHVVQNLLDNSLKYSRHRDEIEIEVNGLVKGPDNVYEIKDNGSGLQKENAKNIFRLFERGRQQGEVSGTGAGLAIAERIVSRHGGKIWAEGEPNVGASFYFTLPNGA